MNANEGTNAVQNARFVITILGVLSLIGGVIAMVLTEFVLGGALVASAICDFILNAILKGFERITRACEMYIEKEELSKIKED